MQKKHFVEAIWSKVDNMNVNFFQVASTLESFTWNLMFQVVIDLIVIAGQICKKSNNDNWIWNASDRLFGYLVTYFDPRNVLIQKRPQRSNLLHFLLLGRIDLIFYSGRDSNSFLRGERGDASVRDRTFRVMCDTYSF